MWLLLLLLLAGCTTTSNIDSIDCEPSPSKKCYSVSYELLDAYVFMYDTRTDMKKALKQCQERL